MRWKPNVTVAALVERDGRYLIVEEETDDGLRLNQPAGHLEKGESLLDAVRREVLEETGYSFEPKGLVGIYLADKAGSDITYLRFTFFGQVTAHHPERPLDDGIVAAHWLSADELAAQAARHRSPLVARSLADWQAGLRYPLELLQRVE
jgi:8-oxo-dGTP pyrophosphatase MutT (NUDIX family)